MNTKGSIGHLLLHALGLMHEQSRGDRDEYVRVNWSNVRGKDPRWIFIKYPSFNNDFRLDEPYDYKSIMHFGAHAFAIDPLIPTLEPLDSNIPLGDLGIGRRNGLLTRSDARKLSKMYECE